VDTSVSPPVPKALSNETGLTPENICEIRSFVDWKTPALSTVFYVLKGPNNACWDSDDVNRAVRLNMFPTSAPVALPHKYLAGFFLTEDMWSVIFQRIQANSKFVKRARQPWGPALTSPTSTAARIYRSFDNDLMIGRLDSNLGYYKYRSPTAAGLLYVANANTEQLAEAKLDKPNRDGTTTLYFSVVGRVAPYTNRIKMVTVPASGNADPASVTTLATIKTTKPLDWMNLSVTSGYIVYSVPNAANDGAVVYSVKKTSTTPNLPGIKLVDSNVNGGVVGSFFFFEDRDGRWARSM